MVQYFSHKFSHNLHQLKMKLGEECDRATEANLNIIQCDTILNYFLKFRFLLSHSNRFVRGNRLLSVFFRVIRSVEISGT